MPTPDEDVYPAQDIQFILVHGTFATNAPWMADSSAFVGSLRAEFGEGVQVTKFNWDGNNSFKSRKNAEIKLINLIERMSSEDVSKPMVIIAHSHGGNIALRAVSRMKDSRPVLALITLGTPFIFFKYRQEIFYRLYSGAFSLWFGLLIFLPILLPAGYSYLIFSVFAYPIAVFFTYPHVYRKLESATQKANSKIYDQGLNPRATEVPLLCIRHGADEAGIWMLILQLVKRLEKMFFWFASLSDRTRLIPFRLALVLVVLTFELSIAGGMETWENVPISLLLIAPIGIAARLVTSHKWGLGGRPDLTSFCFDVEVEPYPEVSPNRHVQKFSSIFGAWRIASVHGVKKLMTPHSMGYSDPAAIKKICTWINYVKSAYL